MILEHLIYSTAIAIVFGMLYHRITGREYSWIIVASAYAPDFDVFADALFKKLGITILVFGSPIDHGDFHNIAVLAVYATAVAFLLHPMGIRFRDSLAFAGVGFAAHLFEDALVFEPGYRFFWPLSMEKFGLGWMSYTPDLYGMADREVLMIGLGMVGIFGLVRTAIEGTGWIRRMMCRPS